MKILHNFPALILVVLLFVQVSCNSTGSSDRKASVAESNARIEVSISGMTCTGCEQTIQAGVSKIEGVSSVKADFKAGKAVIDYNSASADTTAIRVAITSSGYKVTGFKNIPPTE